MKNKLKPFACLLFACLLLSCGSPASSSSNNNEGDGGEGEAGSSANSGSNASASGNIRTGTLPAIDHIQVFCLKTYTHVWAWNNTGDVFSKWPGSEMPSFDDVWNTYEFADYTSLKIIFSKNGDNQTTASGLEAPSAGYWWYHDDTWECTNTIPEVKPATLPTTHDDVVIPQGSHDTVTSASSWQDFPVWNKYPQSYWTTINKYNGSRDDFRDESIYFTITTRFYDGDSSNNDPCWGNKKNASSDPAWRGDFKGLIEKMDYIKALGFTAIWITPIVKNASGYDYHGYHAINMKEVDPRYESEDVDFQDVIDAAHSRDMKIILDVVFNHTGNWGEENLFPMFYRYYDDLTEYGLIPNTERGKVPDNYADCKTGDAQFQARVHSMKDFPADGGHDDEYIYHHEKNMDFDKYIEQIGSMAGDCIDLNTENPTVCNYLVEAYGQFIRMGVDAFRIDTMKHISRLTFNNYLWPAFQEFARKCGNTHFHMFGEVCARMRGVWNKGGPAESSPFYTWKENKNYAWGSIETNLESAEQNWYDNANEDTQRTSSNVYLNNGLTYHTPDYSQSSGCSVIDFPMHWNFYNASNAYNVAVSGDQYYNDASYNVVYVDSHDYSPDECQKLRFTGGTDAWAENMDLMFTFRGVPCVYYGSEIEFKKGATIDEGPNIALENSGRAYYGAHLEGNVTATGFGTYTASGEVQNTLNSTLSKHLQKLNQIRLKVPALRRGQYKSFGNMAFVRRYVSGSMDSLACVSISDGAYFTGLPNGSYVNLVNGDRQNVTNGTLSTNNSGKGSMAVYVLDNGASGTLGKIGDSLTYLR